MSLSSVDESIDPRFHDGVVFDLDGVVIDTASIQFGSPATGREARPRGYGWRATITGMRAD